MQHRKNYRSLDISGNRYGRLVALKRVDGTRTQWHFKCDCGNDVELNISRVFDRQLSCGCMRKEFAKKFGDSHITHGGSKTTLYRKYRSMIDRCYNSGTWKYKRYGGRGIYVCDEWKNSFAAFQKWAYETGYDPSLDGRTEQSIDRIDNDGPYSPENCRWATSKEQMINREITKVYPYNGEMYTASSFADTYGIHDKTFVYGMIKRWGMSLEEVLYAWEIKQGKYPYLIKASEYAEKRKVTITTVNRWVREGKVKFVKAGNNNYIDIRGSDDTR